VLPRAHRVTRPDDFRRILRRGRSAGRRRLVLHAIVGSDTVGPDIVGSDGASQDGVARTPLSRAGLVVGRSVGSSVVRHRVSRQLRHLVAVRLGDLPPGTELVVRAQAPAAQASSRELGAALDKAQARLGLAAPVSRGRSED
jgi:ribonuclease P protein component